MQTVLLDKQVKQKYGSVAGTRSRIDPPITEGETQMALELQMEWTLNYGQKVKT